MTRRYQDRDILEAIDDHWRRTGYGPGMRDIAAAIGTSSTSVVRYRLERLQARGLVAMTPGVARSIRTTGNSDGK